MPGQTAFCGLLPHPPIVVPAVGGERTAQCAATLDACRQFARDLVASEPSRLVLVSPHSPRRFGAYGIWDGERLVGDLSQFGAAEAAVDLPNDGAFGERLAEHCDATWPIPPAPLDHGAIVPLWFVVEAGWTGPTCIVSLGGDSDAAFGRAIGAAARDLDGETALIASGDMTHRAKPGAPAGYHPQAVRFDHQLVELVRAGDLRGIESIDPAIREIAAEDAAESSTIAAAAIDYEARQHEVLSYEHPFGVGYMIAIFHRAP